MATTPKGIYYPNDYNEIADIPEDMKKMAESIDGVFEDTDSDLSDIKEEQTTQNNRLNSLEVDNTTNKSDILTNKQEINNIKTEQTEQNTNISTNATNIESLQEENENLKKIVSQLPQVTGQGTEVTLENTIEAPFTLFSPEGHSEQETTEGYNLLGLPDYAQTKNGVTITIKDGTITFSGTSTNVSSFDIPIPDIILNTTDKFSIAMNDSNTIPSGLGRYLLDNDKNLIKWSYGMAGLQNATNFYPQSDTTAKYLRLALNTTNVNFTGFSCKIMFNAGATAKEWEKYTGGIASPNPNYEQPIKSAGDNGSITEKIVNRNWFNKNTIIEGKYIDNNGNFVNESSNFVSDFIKLLSIDTNLAYSISATTGRAKRIVYYDNSKTFISRQLIYATQGKLNIPETALYVRLSCYNDDLESLQLEIIEEGSTATPYVPHEEQDYSIPVQQPMRSIGDVRDCFVKKSDGWYERHYIGRYIFTGNEYFSTLSQGIYRFNAKANNVDTKVYDNNIIANALSNYFIIETATHIAIGSSYDGHFAISSTGTFDFNVQKFASATELKNWLAEQYANGTPVYVDYLLETPLDLPCTETQIQQLENKPSTYKDFTIINSEDETEAYLEVSGIYDLNKLITRTEVLESES